MKYRIIILIMQTLQVYIKAGTTRRKTNLILSFIILSLSKIGW